MYGNLGLPQNAVQVQRLLALQRIQQYQQQQQLLLQQQNAIRIQQRPLPQALRFPVIAPIRPIVPPISQTFTLTDFKPSVLVVFQRLIHEHSTQYREAIQKKNESRAKTIVKNVNDALLATCAPFGNLFQELPPKYRLQCLIRSSLDVLVGQSKASKKRHVIQSKTTPKGSNNSGNDSIVEGLAAAKSSKTRHKQQQANHTTNRQQQSNLGAASQQRFPEIDTLSNQGNTEAFSMLRQRQLDHQKMLCLQIISILKQRQTDAKALLNQQTLDPVTRSGLANGLLDRQRLMDAQSAHLDRLMQLEKQISTKSPDTKTAVKSQKTARTPNEKKEALSKGDFKEKSSGKVSSKSNSQVKKTQTKSKQDQETKSKNKIEEPNIARIESREKCNTHRKRKRSMVLPISQSRKTMTRKDEDNVDAGRIRATAKKTSPSVLKQKTQRKKMKSTQNSTRIKSLAKPDVSKSSSLADIPHKSDKIPPPRINRENRKSVKRKKMKKRTGKALIRTKEHSTKRKTTKVSSPEVNEVSRSDGPIPGYLPPSVQKALKRLAPHNIPGNTTVGDNAFIIDAALNFSSRREQKRRRKNIDYSKQF